MSNKLPLTGEMDHDERTTREWFEDQGLEYVNTAPKLEKVKWLKKNLRETRKADYDVSFTETTVCFSWEAVREMNATYVRLGSGLFGGEVVLLVRPTVKGQGYKLTGGRKITCHRPAQRLMQAGLQVGKYKLYKAKDGYYARLIKGEGYASSGK